MVFGSVGMREKLKWNSCCVNFSYYINDYPIRTILMNRLLQMLLHHLLSGEKYRKGYFSPTHPLQKTAITDCDTIHLCSENGNKGPLW